MGQGWIARWGGQNHSSGVPGGEEEREEEDDDDEEDEQEERDVPANEHSASTKETASKSGLLAVVCSPFIAVWQLVMEWRHLAFLATTVMIVDGAREARRTLGQAANPIRGLGGTRSPPKERNRQRARR